MASNFDSFDASPLGDFVQSPLGDRNGGPEGDVLVWIGNADYNLALYTLYKSLGAKVKSFGLPNNVDTWNQQDVEQFGLIITNYQRPSGDWLQHGVKPPRRLVYLLPTGTEVRDFIAGFGMTDGGDVLRGQLTAVSHPLTSGVVVPTGYGSGGGFFQQAIGGTPLFAAALGGPPNAVVSVASGNGVEVVVDWEPVTLIALERNHQDWAAQFFKNLWTVR